MTPLFGAGLVLFSAFPAWAYPTSIISIPTGETLSVGRLHFGLYGYPVGPSGDFSFNTGLFDGFQAGETKIGSLEFGFDSNYPQLDYDESMQKGLAFSLSAKLGLMTETDSLPAIGLGFYYLGVPSLNGTPNLSYLSMTKSIQSSGIDLGTYTAGLYRVSPLIDESLGFWAGVTHELPFNLSLLGDFTSSASPANSYGGSNVALCLTPFDAFSITSGYYLSNNREEPGDAAFLFLDYEIALGGKAGE
ncbi:MAG TPA: hypothetical protein DD435_04215 [Cyanobacteria bacterium UBA8530]|nr:hypothetical protein [Cyanobacteria bacterium UBA8530]